MRRYPIYYLKTFSDYPGVDLKHLHVGEVIPIRAFFGRGAGENIRAAGGYLDLEVEPVEGDAVFGVILTKLPKEFPLQAGGSIEIFKDEILDKAEMTEHCNGTQKEPSSLR